MTDIGGHEGLRATGFLQKIKKVIVRDSLTCSGRGAPGSEDVLCGTPWNKKFHPTIATGS